MGAAAVGLDRSQHALPRSVSDMPPLQDIKQISIKQQVGCNHLHFKLNV